MSSSCDACLVVIWRLVVCLAPSFEVCDRGQADVFGVPVMTPHDPMKTKARDPAWWISLMNLARPLGGGLCSVTAAL